MKLAHSFAFRVPLEGSIYSEATSRSCDISPANFFGQWASTSATEPEDEQVKTRISHGAGRRGLALVAFLPADPNRH